MFPLISGKRDHIGWIIVPTDIEAEEIDYYDAETFCKSHRPYLLDEGTKLVPLYSDEFPGGKFLCERCQNEFEFDEE